MEAYCRGTLGVKLASTSPLPPLRHVLTHFTMDIQPTLGEVSKVLPKAALPDAQWVPPTNRGEAITLVVPLVLETERRRKGMRRPCPTGAMRSPSAPRFRNENDSQARASRALC